MRPARRAPRSRAALHCGVTMLDHPGAGHPARHGTPPPGGPTGPPRPPSFLTRTPSKPPPAPLST
jgi:hypothetical protein